MKASKCFILSCVMVLAMIHSSIAAMVAIRAGRIIPVSGPDIGSHYDYARVIAWH